MARETIRDWLDTTNGGAANSCNHDSRQKLTKEQRQEIFALADSGSTYRDVAYNKAIASRPYGCLRTAGSSRRPLDQPGAEGQRIADSTTDLLKKARERRVGS